MRFLFSAAVSLLSLVSLGSAQSVCSSGGVTMAASASQVVPGQVVRFTVTNESATQIAAVGTGCAVRSGGCAGPVIANPPCPPGIEIAAGGGAHTFYWDQRDQAGRRVLEGTYAFEWTYDDGLGTNQTCCVTVDVARPATPTLLLGGRQVERALMGERVDVIVAGPSDAGLPVTLLADLTPGPVTVAGLSVPIGATPAMLAVPLGVTDETGAMWSTFRAPAFPDSVGTIFMTALIQDPQAAVGFVVTNGVEIEIVDRNVELAGNTLPSGEFPFFEHVRAFNAGSTVEVAIDPTRHVDLVGRTVDLFVVASKTRSEWLADPTLADVRGGPQRVFLRAGGVQNNTFTVDTGSLSGDTGTVGLGVPYDIVVDVDRNGTFDMDGRDLADGYSDGEAGFYVVHDLGAPGPLTVAEDLYNLGGNFLGQKVYYPASIAQMGLLPLIVVAHGNGHNYQWYDHIGQHMASYGYIVMSHTNNTMPGPVAASNSTLNNVDAMLDNLDTIANGDLLGHVDVARMTWLGHSRGGEGVVIAYDRIIRGLFTPVNYQASDIRLVSSIAPTDFQNLPQTNPHSVNYHLWVGQSDTDVHGCASQDLAQSYQIHDRAQQTRASISLYGVGHGDFHAGGGLAFASGPNLIGRVATHDIMRPYFFALCEFFVNGNVPAKDYLWRQYESFRAISSPTGTGFEINLQFREGTQRASKQIIDNFQINSATNLASSGAAVSFTTPVFRENNFDDRNTTFTHDIEDGFNGFTNDGDGADNSRGIAFNVDGATTHTVTFDLLPGQYRFDRYEYLSFRAAQCTRHPLTIAAEEDFTFEVVLRDGGGIESAIEFGAYGGGIEEPYQRNGNPRCGVVRGWNNEFETIRIRLEDFLTNADHLDLADVRTVEFRFDPSQTSRLGMDDIELVK